jgi:hypothetical protein
MFYETRVLTKEKYENYRPLAKVRKELRAKWYRSAIEFAKLRELTKRSDLQGWFQAGGTTMFPPLKASGVLEASRSIEMVTLPSLS